MESDTFVPLVFFLFLAAIILIPIWLRERTKQSAHKLISQALDKGQPLDPEVMRELTQSSTKQQQQQNGPRRTLGWAIILLAMAAAFGGLALVDDGWHSWSMTPAIILGAIGGAFLVLAVVDYSNKKKDM